MRELEARDDVLKGLLAQEPAIVRTSIQTCRGSIGEGRAADGRAQQPEDRNEAAEAIRALVEKITFAP